jgi:tetratricopeptide (TPR) repeat protein
VDASNPVFARCIDGMKAETERRFADARRLFEDAWAAATDDFEACVAAHYVARHQDRPEDTRRWNEVALQRADAVGDERVQGFYPSLYLNLGKSYEDLGARDQARRCYERAAEHLDRLPEGPYRDMVERGIATGRARVAG